MNAIERYRSLPGARYTAPDAVWDLEKIEHEIESQRVMLGQMLAERAIIAEKCREALLSYWTQKEIAESGL